MLIHSSLILSIYSSLILSLNFIFLRLFISVFRPSYCMAFCLLELEIVSSREELPSHRENVSPHSRVTRRVRQEESSRSSPISAGLQLNSDP